MSTQSDLEDPLSQKAPDDDDVPEEPEGGETKTSKRYGLSITTSRHGKTWGVWDGKEGVVIEVYCTRDEAEEALARVIADT